MTAEFDRPGVANVDKIKGRVSVFLGIPYAQPPIGEARLMVRKVKTILRESKMKITLFRLKLPANLSVCHALKAGEVIVKSRPHFCLQGIYFYHKIS